MLQTIRDRATGWIAYTIVALLIIPFALWGVNSYFGEAPVVNIAEVGGHEISLREFQIAYQRQRNQLRSLMGGQLDPNLFDETRLRYEVLRQLVDDAVLEQTAREQGLRIGDQQLGQLIQSNQAFLRDGQFDLESYQRILQQQQYTPTAFEAEMRASMVGDQLRSGVAESSFLTDAEVDRLLALLKQRRETSYLALGTDTLDDVELDEAEIQAYYDENQQQFNRPERVKVRYLDLTLEKLAETMEVGEGEIEAAYNEQLPRFTHPEERKASHILVTIPEDSDSDTARKHAETIYQSIVDGSRSFQEAMTEASSGESPDLEGGELGTIRPGMMAPSFEQALFALEEEGAISDPVETDFGFHIIRLDELVPEEAQPLEAVRDELASELRVQAAEPQFYEAAETLATMSFENPDSLEPAAEVLGLEIQTSDWLTRDSQDGIAAHPGVLGAAFSPEVLGENYNSDAIEVGGDRVLVLHLDEYEASAPMPLEEAREQVEEALRARRLGEQLDEVVSDLEEQIRAGGDFQTLAESFGAALTELGPVTRDESGVDSAVLAEAFRLPLPTNDDGFSVGSTQLDEDRRAVVIVTDVLPGDLAEVDDAERAQFMDRWRSQMGNSQFQSFLESRRRQMDIVTYSERL